MAYFAVGATTASHIGRDSVPDLACLRDSASRFVCLYHPRGLPPAGAADVLRIRENLLPVTLKPL